MLVYNHHQPASNKWKIRDGQRKQLCEHIMSNAIKACQEDSGCLGFLFGGDASCDVDIWRNACARSLPASQSIFLPSQFLFACDELQQTHLAQKAMSPLA